MALTIASLENRVFGNAVIVTCALTFDSSYATGGESLTAGNLGLSVIDFIMIQTTAGLIFEYDYTNSKVKAFLIGVTTGASASTTAGTTKGAKLVDSQAAQTAARLLGTTVSTTYDLGFMKEVPNTTNLSTINNVRVFAVGV